MKVESKLLDWQSSQPTGGAFFLRELHRSLGSAGEAGLQGLQVGAEIRDCSRKV